MLLQEDGIIILIVYFFFQAEDGIRDDLVTGVQTCALPIYGGGVCPARRVSRPRGPRYKRESISEQDKLHLHDRLAGARVERSEERRVGKECRTGGSPQHKRKTSWRRLRQYVQR